MTVMLCTLRWDTCTTAIVFFPCFHFRMAHGVWSRESRKAVDIVERLYLFGLQLCTFELEICYGDRLARVS